MPMIEVPRLNRMDLVIALQDMGFPGTPRMALPEGVRVVFTVKERLSDDETLVRIQKDNLGLGLEITDREQGEILVTLTPGDLKLPPSDYYYDIFIIGEDYAYSCEPNIFRVKPTVLGVLP